MKQSGAWQDLPVKLVEESMTGAGTAAVSIMSSSGDLPDLMWYWGPRRALAYRVLAIKSVQLSYLSWGK